jgi:hypothetical protein
MRDLSELCAIQEQAVYKTAGPAKRENYPQRSTAASQVFRRLDYGQDTAVKRFFELSRGLACSISYY